MAEIDRSYDSKIFKRVIDKYIDKIAENTEDGLKLSQTNHDDFVWSLAAKIYQESGHKVELSLVRDVLNSRIEIMRHQLADAKKQIYEEVFQGTEEKQRISEEAHQVNQDNLVAEEARLITEDPHFLRKITEAIGKFGGDEHKAKIFVRVRRIISERLQVDESQVTLDSHLSSHLGADEYDLIELVNDLDEEFGIEITESESEKELGMGIFLNFGSGFSLFSGSGFVSGSGSSYSSSENAGEDCIVRNFVELIYKKVSS